jgi:hypothetical protein
MPCVLCAVVPINSYSVSSTWVGLLRPDDLLDLVRLRRLQLLREVPDPDPDVRLDFVRIKDEVALFRFLAPTSGNATVDVQGPML